MSHLKTVAIILCLSTLVASCCLFKPRPVEFVTNAWFFIDGSPNQGVFTQDFTIDAAEKNVYATGFARGPSLFCGQIQETSINRQGTVFKFHLDRTCEWYSLFVAKNPGNNDAQCLINKLALDKDENILVTGSFSGSLTYKNQLVLPFDIATRSFVAKLDKTGGLIWAKEFKTTRQLALTQLLVLPNNTFIAFGQNSEGGDQVGTVDTYLVNFDSEGTLLWQTFINTPLYDSPGDIRLSRHNSFYSLTTGGRQLNEPGIILIKEWDFAGKEMWSFQQPTGILTQRGYLAVDGKDNLWFGATFNATITPFIFGTDTIRTSRSEDSYIARFENRKPAFSTVLSGSDVDLITGLYDEVDGKMALTINHGPDLTAFGKTYTVTTPYAFSEFIFDAGKPEQATATSYGTSFESPGFPRISRLMNRVVRNGNIYIGGRLSGTLHVGTDTLTTKANWGGFLITKQRKKKV